MSSTCPTRKRSLKEFQRTARDDPKGEGPQLHRDSEEDVHDDVNFANLDGPIHTAPASTERVLAANAARAKIRLACMETIIQRAGSSSRG